MMFKIKEFFIELVGYEIFASIPDDGYSVKEEVDRWKKRGHSVITLKHKYKTHTRIEVYIHA